MEEWVVDYALCETVIVGLVGAVAVEDDSVIDTYREYSPWWEFGN